MKLKHDFDCRAADLSHGDSTAHTQRLSQLYSSRCLKTDQAAPWSTIGRCPDSPDLRISAPRITNVVLNIDSENKRFHVSAGVTSHQMQSHSLIHSLTHSLTLVSPSPMRIIFLALLVLAGQGQCSQWASHLEGLLFFFLLQHTP